jgi:hypothetical protein
LYQLESFAVVLMLVAPVVLAFAALDVDGAVGGMSGRVAG